MKRGLTVPLRSSIVRRYLALGTRASTLYTYATIIYAEAVGFIDEFKAWRSRECTTIWTDLGIE
jgi:hypothetical protein